MPRRTIAIGDIHGYVKALDALVAAIQPEPDDLLIPLGDYVDRGPDTRAVIDRLIDLSGKCDLVPLVGNHEVLMLAAMEGTDVEFWLDYGGRETLASYGDCLDAVPAEHVEFLKSCRRFYETPDYLFFHANYDPELPPDVQPEHLLLWEHMLVPTPPHCSGKTVVVGHTPQGSGEILDLGHVLCIDTCCYGGRWLTALEVDTRRTWQADGDGNMPA